MSEAAAEHPHGAMRRKDRGMTDRAEIDAVLNTEHILHLALAGDGVPYLVPLNFGYDGEAVYIHSAPIGTKIAILKRNPRVCFEVLAGYELIEAEEACDYSARFLSVIGAGRAVFLEDPAEKARALDIIMAKVSERRFEYPPAMLAKTAVIRIGIESIQGKRKGF
jgi:uncharacterized protein